MDRVSRSKWLWNFDVFLQTFYHDIIQKEMDIENENDVFEIKKAMREVVNSYKKDPDLKWCNLKDVKQRDLNCSNFKKRIHSNEIASLTRLHRGENQPWLGRRFSSHQATTEPVFETSPIDIPKSINKVRVTETNNSGDLQTFPEQRQSSTDQTKSNPLLINHKTEKDFRSSTLRFDTAAKRCAYVLKHGPCFTGAVARHFLRLLTRKAEVLQKLFERRKIRICCLGGGPASDAVAVVSVISLLYQPWFINTRRPLEFEITVIDWNEDWSTTSRHVIETLAINNDSIDMKFRFLKADLSLQQPLDPRVQSSISRAHLCTMVYFLSAVNEGKNTPQSNDMIRKIMSALKPSAILFFLDSAADVHYKQMSTVASTLGNIKQVYNSELEEFHRLSLASVYSYQQIYEPKLSGLLCMTNCFICAAAWVKLKQSSEVNRSLKTKPKCSDPCMQQKMDDLTRRMLSYRLKVQKILSTESGRKLKQPRRNKTQSPHCGHSWINAQHHDQNSSKVEKGETKLSAGGAPRNVTAREVLWVPAPLPTEKLLFDFRIQPIPGNLLKFLCPVSKQPYCIQNNFG